MDGERPAIVKVKLRVINGKPGNVAHLTWRGWQSSKYHTVTFCTIIRDKSEFDAVSDDSTMRVCALCNRAVASMAKRDMRRMARQKED